MVQPPFAVPLPSKGHKQPLAFSVAGHRAARRGNRHRGILTRKLSGLRLCGEFPFLPIRVHWCPSVVALPRKLLLTLNHAYQPLTKIPARRAVAQDQIPGRDCLRNTTPRVGRANLPAPPLQRRSQTKPRHRRLACQNLRFHGPGRDPARQIFKPRRPPKTIFHGRHPRRRSLRFHPHVPGRG